MAQHTNSEGVRKSRWAIIRQTAPMLKSTTIKTFQDWIPHELCPITYGSPIKGRMNCMLPDNTVLDAEFIFLALDRPDSVERLKSLELTGAFINEAGEMNPRILEVLKGRVGRYPAAKDGGWSWKGIILDSNPPSMRSWYYKLFEVEKPPAHVIYKQPSPLLYDQQTRQYYPNPDAENVAGHVPANGTYIDGYSYWLDQIPGLSQDIIDTLIMGKYGAVYDGRRVYTAYEDFHNLSRTPINGDRALDLVIGFDFGLMPAAVFTQMGQNGRMVVLHEEVGEEITLDEFLIKQVVPMLRTKFRQYNAIFVGDPAGGQRSHLRKVNAYQVMRDMGLNVKKAYTNDIAVRIRSVEYFINRRDGFLLSPTCGMLKEGFDGGYRYKKQSAAELDKKPTPDKNEFSHPHDALQYAALYHYKGYSRAQRRLKNGVNRNQRNSHQYA